MPDRPSSPPKYRHYKPKNLAVVRINGRDHYLGRYNSPESRERYGKLLAEWFTAGRVDPFTAQSTSAVSNLTVSELILAYLRHAGTYYQTPASKSSSELGNIKDALRPVRKLYGSSRAEAFGPLALRAVRQSMIQSGLAYTTINARIHRVRRAFRWAASVEMIPGSIVQGLASVESLKSGRSEAKDPDEIRAVPLEVVEATLPYLSRPVAGMVRFQLLTGCRVSEVAAIRPCDLTLGDPTWEYRPCHHKNEWRGHTRIIPIGPRAQSLVKEFAKPDLNAYLFDPRDVVAEHHANRARLRRTKPAPSELARRRVKPGREHAPRYDRRTYRQAVVRACDKAFPHPTLSTLRSRDLNEQQREELRTWRRAHRWSPLQLRHTAATLIASMFGLEAASNVLGHTKLDTTLIYAERDLAKARTIMSQIG